MPLVLLEGTTSVVELTSQARDAAGTLAGTAASLKCQYRTMSFESSRSEVGLQVTFCTTGGYAKPVLGPTRADISFGGFMSKGAASSSPVYFFTQVNPNFQFTQIFDDPTPSTAGSDRCALTFDAQISRDANSIEAQGQSSRLITGVVDGTTLTTVWVVT
jgi:hypothetical protein